MSEPILGSERGVSRAGIVLEDVRCTGRETGIFECPTSQLGVVNNPQCQNAAAVTCTRGELVRILVHCYSLRETNMSHCLS